MNVYIEEMKIRLTFICPADWGVFGRLSLLEDFSTAPEVFWGERTLRGVKGCFGPIGEQKKNSCQIKLNN